MKKIVHITKDSEIPLLGLVQMGIIDRGTNLIQARPTSVCNLNCIYCSTDSGAHSKYKTTDYVVEKEYFLDWLREVVKFKKENGCKDIEVNLDSCGEVFTHPDVMEIIEKISKMKCKISMQTNGVLLDEKKIKKMEKLGVSQINLSLNSLNSEKCKELSGCESYDLKHIKEVAELINKSKIKLLIAPVWIQGKNEILDIVRYCKKLGCKIGIQNYEVHKYGRKVKSVKRVNYYKFYKLLENIEKEEDFKLKLGPLDFKISKCKRVPYKFKKGEIVEVEIKAGGWMKNEKIGVARNRALTVFNCGSKIGDKVKVKILEISNGIYLSKRL